MGRPPKVQTTQDEAPIAESRKMVLKKNHGHIFNGRDCKFYPAGSEFDVAAEADLIAALIRTGAHLE